MFRFSLTFTNFYRVFLFSIFLLFALLCFSFTLTKFDGRRFTFASFNQNERSQNYSVEVQRFIEERENVYAHRKSYLRKLCKEEKLVNYNPSKVRVTRLFYCSFRYFLLYKSCFINLQMLSKKSSREYFGPEREA